MTLRDIAKLANVSPAAVSLVLNNKPGVSEQKRQEIMDIIKEHNYVPTKRSLPPSRNLTFLKYVKNGHLVEENAGFISTIMDSIESECHSQNYQLTILVVNQNLEETPNNIDYSNTTGLFVLGTELDSSSYHILQKIPCPYVVIDNDMPGFPCNTVTMSNREMVHVAVTHLASLHPASIGYMHSKMPSQNFIERSYGFYQIISKLGLPFDFKDEYLLEPTMLEAYHDMKNYLLKNPKMPDCFFADNDIIALGAIKALKEFGYKIPKDICIIGFDDIRFSAISSPSLSTMHVFKHRIGIASLKLLHEAINNPECRNIKLHINGKLIVRNSTTPKNV